MLFSLGKKILVFLPRMLYFLRILRYNRREIGCFLRFFLLFLGKMRQYAIVSIMIQYLIITAPKKDVKRFYGLFTVFYKKYMQKV